MGNGKPILFQSKHLTLVKEPSAGDKVKVKCETREKYSSHLRAFKKWTRTSQGERATVKERTPKGYTVTFDDFEDISNGKPILFESEDLREQYPYETRKRGSRPKPQRQSRRIQPRRPRWHTCRDCDGDGFAIGDQECGRCNGHGGAVY